MQNLKTVGQVLPEICQYKGPHATFHDNSFFEICNGIRKKRKEEKIGLPGKPSTMHNSSAKKIFNLQEQTNFDTQVDFHISDMLSWSGQVLFGSGHWPVARYRGSGQVLLVPYVVSICIMHTF